MCAAPNYTNSPKIAPGRMSCSPAPTSMEISVSIPAFWPYVNRYLSRAGAVDLTMMISWGTSHLHHGSEDEDTSMNESAVALTTTCFHRSRATHIPFQDLRNYEHEALLRVMTKPAPRLASMHILQESDHIDFPFYQSFHALVELSNNPHECNAAYRGSSSAVISTTLVQSWRRRSHIIFTGLFEAHPVPNRAPSGKYIHRLCITPNQALLQNRKSIAWPFPTCAG
jgi:hypothetical protein